MELARVIGRVFGYAAGLLASLYDVYIAVPLRIEALVRGRHGDDDAADRPRRPRSARASATGESLA